MGKKRDSLGPGSEQAQALTEYILVTAAIGLAMAGVLLILRWPLAQYLRKLISTLAGTN